MSATELRPGFVSLHFEELLTNAKRAAFYEHCHLHMQHEALDL